MTRRGNSGFAKNSRIAKRYTMLAIAREALKYGPPLSMKLCEQIVNDIHNATPSTYTFDSGETFTVRPLASETV